MENFLNRFYDKIGPIASKIATQKHLIAVRDGLVLVMPLTIVGSIFIIIGELPIQAYQDFMVGIFGEAFWGSFVWDMAFPATLGISALVAVFGIAYSYVHNEGIDGLPAGAIALAAYFFLLNFSILEEAGDVGGYFGAEGLFVAIVTALITGIIYAKLVKKDIVIKLPDSVPPTILRSFVALIPSIVILTLFFFIRLGFAATTYETVQNFIIKFMQAPLMVSINTFTGTMLTSVLKSVLWTFGLHGDQIVGSITDPIVTANYLTNVELLKQGLEPIYIHSAGFAEIFLNFGGTGSTLGLLLAMKFACKSKAVHQIANLGLVPSLFNISEPIMFGLPVVLNPIMMIPFILVTLAVGALAYFAFALNLVNYIIVSPPWTTPIFFSGYLATGGDFRAVILQVVLLAVSFILYLPFVRYIDRDYYTKEIEGETE